MLPPWNDWPGARDVHEFTKVTYRSRRINIKSRLASLSQPFVECYNAHDKINVSIRSAFANPEIAAQRIAEPDSASILALGIGRTRVRDGFDS